MKIIGYLLLLLSSAVCSSQIINIPDINFKNRLLASSTTDGYGCIGPSLELCVAGVIDTNGNGEIEISEAQMVAALNVSGANINDLTGIQYFTNLEWLYCGYNQLTSIDVSQLINLTNLNCRNNQITSLDLTTLPHLKTLGCNNNQLTSLNISYQPELEFLIASNNQISSLDFSSNPALQRAYCSYNLISSLDFSSNHNFFDLGCRNNPNLTTIKIRNGALQMFGTDTFYNECWTNVPNLNYICADSNEMSSLQSFLAACGVTQPVTIDSLCALGVEDFNSVAFKLYPNPSRAIFQLSFGNPLSGKAGYIIYDMLGEKLFQTKLAEGSINAQIDLANYENGIYILSVTVGDTTVSKKMVKQ